MNRPKTQKKKSRITQMYVWKLMYNECEYSNQWKQASQWCWDRRMAIKKVKLEPHTTPGVWRYTWMDSGFQCKKACKYYKKACTQLSLTTAELSPHLHPILSLEGHPVWSQEDHQGVRWEGWGAGGQGSFPGFLPAGHSFCQQTQCSFLAAWSTWIPVLPGSNDLACHLIPWA